jgi:hypothetical protein
MAKILRIGIIPMSRGALENKKVSGLPGIKKKDVSRTGG